MPPRRSSRRGGKVSESEDTEPKEIVVETPKKTRRGAQKVKPVEEVEEPMDVDQQGDAKSETVPADKSVEIEADSEQPGTSIEPQIEQASEEEVNQEEESVQADEVTVVQSEEIETVLAQEEASAPIETLDNAMDDVGVEVKEAVITTADSESPKISDTSDEKSAQVTEKRDSVKATDKKKQISVKATGKTTAVSVKSADQTEVVDVKAADQTEVVEVKAVDQTEVVEVKAADQTEVVEVKAADQTEVVEVKSADQTEVVDVKSADQTEVVDVKVADQTEVVEVKSADQTEVVEVKAADQTEVVDVKSADDVVLVAKKSKQEKDGKKRRQEDKDDMTVEEPPKKKSKPHEEPVDEKESQKRSPELDKFWKVVEDDPADFTGWTYLLQFVDANGTLLQGREAYDKFLFKYPYCYGYWKKYADLEKRKGTKESCMAVFDRGSRAIPLSADLWLHYMNYVKIEFVEDESFVRRQYDRAIEACGKEWRSDKLWDHYIKWEVSIQEANSGPGKVPNYSRVLHLYDRILTNPTQGLNHQFDMFREFVKSHNPKDIMEVTDFLSMRKEVLAAMAENLEPKGDVVMLESEDGIPPPGEDDSKAKTDEENLAMRENIIYSRKKVYKETQEKATARSKFEDNIKRPYFHIKPLERAQLKNWNEYLDFEIKETDDVRTEILFERCLIACALYEEFWIKYIGWMSTREKAETDPQMKSNLIEKIRSIFIRACTHHLSNKIEIHLAWAAFEETHSNMAKAVEILEKVSQAHPQMVSLQAKRISAERRGGNFDTVHTLYKSHIKNSKSASHRSEWSVKYSRFLRMQCDEESTAVTVLEDALAADERNPKLYLQLLDIYLHQRPLNEGNILKVFEAALDQTKEDKMSDKHLLMFSQRKAEFLDEFGSDANQILAAQESHAQLFIKLKPEIAKTEALENSAKNIASTTNQSKSGDSRSRSSNGSSSVTYEATNSAAYSAQQASQYQQYGSRYGYPSYSQYPTSYGYNYGSGGHY